MDPFAVFALTVGMVIAASQQAAVMEYYAARAVQPRIVQMVPDPAPYMATESFSAPVPGWIAGAAVGSQIGALASAANPVVRCGGRTCGIGYDAGPVIAGAVIGGLIGHAATTPRPTVYVRPAESPPTASRASAAAAREFTDRWQAFMQPSVAASRRER